MSELLAQWQRKFRSTKTPLWERQISHYTLLLTYQNIKLFPYHLYHTHSTHTLQVTCCVQPSAMLTTENIDNKKTPCNPFHSKAKTERWSSSPISWQGVKDNFSTDAVWIDNIKNLTPGVLAVYLCQDYNNFDGNYGRVLLHTCMYTYFFFTLCIEFRAAHTHRLNFTEVICTTQRDKR
jgi:hypothetical protein